MADAQPNSIAVFSSSLIGGIGHVAWVDAVNGRQITITEMNSGPGATAENGYRTTGFGGFDTRTAGRSPGDAIHPDPLRFLQTRSHVQAWACPAVKLRIV